MVYLLYGLRDYEINSMIKKITKEIDNMNISKYDLNNDSIKDVIEDCETFSLFQDKKVVIAENADMFTGCSNKDSEEILKYLQNINPFTILIFIVHSEKIDGRKKITALIKKNGKVIELNDYTNINKLIKNTFKDYIIDNKVLDIFINRVGNNPLIIENEASKIKLYKGSDKTITEEDVINLTIETIDIDIFKLIDNIVKRNREEAIETYHEMLKVNEEPLKVLIMLANQFRIMYQSKELMFKGYSEKSIATTLKIHPYRVKLAIQNSRSYNSKTLLKYLSKLADIDLGIKTGKLNKDLALELFLLE